MGRTPYLAVKGVVLSRAKLHSGAPARHNADVVVAVVKRDKKLTLEDDRM